MNEEIKEKGGSEVIPKLKNTVSVVGVVKEYKVSHEMYGEKMYSVALEIERKSGTKDTLPLIMPERLLEKDFGCGKKILASGQIRSYMRERERGFRHEVAIFVTEYKGSEGRDVNDVKLSGFICRKPVYRTTPFGREICELMLAVNRAYNKSDYIPCIVWGRNARFTESLDVGEAVSIAGRLQSRGYVKNLGNGKVEERTVYEVSVSSIATIDMDCGMEDIEEYFLKGEQGNGE